MMNNFAKKIKEMGRAKMNFGKIEFPNKVIVSDPCYNSLTWCTKLLNIKAGAYNTYVTFKDCKNWGVRVANIIVKLVGHSKVSPSEYVGTIGVDSGQCGIYGYDFFASKDNDKDWDNANSWYRGVCNETCAGDFYKDDNCIVTSSGYGDGGYGVYVGKDNNGEIVAIKVNFYV